MTSAEHPVRLAVLLCPPLAPDSAAPPWAESLAAELGARGVPVVAAAAPIPSAGPPDVAGGPDHRMALAGWVADQAVAVSTSAANVPLLVLAHGSAVRGLPALGLSQRAARHDVVGYVMVDGAIPPPGRHAQDWPDARVVYVRSPDAEPLGAATANDHGWEVHEGEPADVCLSLILAWPGPPTATGATP